jgi:hypothetical protein
MGPLSTNFSMNSKSAGREDSLLASRMISADCKIPGMWKQYVPRSAQETVQYCSYRGPVRAKLVRSFRVGFLDRDYAAMMRGVLNRYEADVRQEASNFRMVVLSIAPTLYIAEAEEWIASKASLLNLRLPVIANLHPISIPKQLVYLLSCQTSVCFHQPAEAGQLIVLNVCPILLCK